VYGIVTNHGGVVSVVSPPGQGTTVRVFLPAQEKIVKDQATKVEDLRGTETVLLVDDEEMVLTLGRTVLSAYGYRVVTANNGPQALQLFGQAPSQIDLVVTDLVMPGMSGRELIDCLRRVSPTVPVLSTSGYLRSAGEDECYLRKPFTSQELLRKIKQVLLKARLGGM
jgi:CheY-like chemotaxis protein